MFRGQARADEHGEIKRQAEVEVAQPAHIRRRPEAQAGRLDLRQQPAEPGNRQPVVSGDDHCAQHASRHAPRSP